MSKILQGVVDGVFLQGKHGPYAMIKDKELGSVTFSLLPEVWKEKKNPEEGAEVILEDIHKKRGGWRAGSARLLRPEDIGNSKTSSAK